MAAITVEATIDSLMNQKRPDTNYGANPSMTHQLTYDFDVKSAWYRSIANFDVSALAGLTVVSAKLVRQIWAISNGGQQARISRCTRPAQWTENGVTWHKYDGVNNWTAVGGDYDDDGPPGAINYTEPLAVGPHEVAGLKPFVEDALANRSGIVSIITRLVDEDPGVTTQYLWRAKEYGSDVWRLVVEHSDIEPRRSVFSPQASILPSAARPARAVRPARGAHPVRPAPPTRRA